MGVAPWSGGAIATAAILLAAGCAAPAGPTPTPSPTPSPAAVALAAGERMLAVSSLHFVVEHAGSLVYLDDPPTLAIKRIEGDVERPDRMRAIVRLWTLGVVSEVGVVGLGEDVYVTNPLNQQWERLPPGELWFVDPTLLFDPEYGIRAILQTAEWAYREGEEETEGRYHLHATLPGERLRLLSSGLIHGGEVTVDVWIDAADSLVHAIRVVETESDPENPTRWDLAFSAFDEPVGVQAPPVP